MFRNVDRRSSSRSLPTASRLPSFCPPLTPSALGRPSPSLFLFFPLRIQKLFKPTAPHRPAEVRAAKELSEPSLRLVGNRERGSSFCREKEKQDFRQGNEWEQGRIRLVSELRIQFAVSRVLRLQSISPPKVICPFDVPVSASRTQRTTATSLSSSHFRLGAHVYDRGKLHLSFFSSSYLHHFHPRTYHFTLFSILSTLIACLPAPGELSRTCLTQRHPFQGA